MVIYNYFDPRHVAFVLGAVFLVLCSISSLDPRNFLTYIPFFSGVLTVALYGIYTSSHRLLWPAIITTGLLTLVSVYESILSAPYLIVPHMMCNWDQCNQLLTGLNSTDSDYNNITTTEFSKTISCFFTNLLSWLHFVPFLCVNLFGLFFLLLKKSQSLIKRQNSPLPGDQEEASDGPLINMQLIGLSSFIILSVAFVVRHVAFVFSPKSYTTAELAELGATAAFAGFSTVLFCYADLEKAFAAEMLLFSLIKAFVDDVHSAFVMVNSMIHYHNGCHDFNSQLKALNVTVDLGFSQFYSWKITAFANNTDLNTASLADITCFNNVEGIDFAYCFHLLVTCILLVCSCSFWEEILFSDESFIQTTKKIIQRGF